MNRREFIKAGGLLGAGVGAGSNPLIAASESGKAAASGLVMPTPAQKAWMDLGFGLFVHHGINTYYDKEWSDGTLDAAKYNPDKLDTDQWCRAAKAAGMKYVVMVTKHHDGFCLWPTKYTQYSVMAGPFKQDVVEALANSASKFGLKFGVYYSLWDRHERSHDRDINRYVYDFMLPQLEELLTQYGEIAELWFDGFWKYQKTGWTKKNAEIVGEAARVDANAERSEKFMTAWRTEGAYFWQMDHMYQQVKKWQPDCMVMNNSTTAYPGVPLFPVDVRSGEKYTKVVEDRKLWSWLGKDVYLPMQIETTMSSKGNEKFPSGNWFWHEWDRSVLSTRQIHSHLDVARRMEANLLLNVGPSDRGLLRPEDERTLMSLKG